MSSTTRTRTLLLASVAVFALLLASCGDDTGNDVSTGSDLPGTDYDGEIVFGDLNWDSALFHNRIAQYVLENGYGYNTTSIPGGTIALTQGLINGDIDVAMEMTPEQQPDYVEAVEAGTVLDHGLMFAGSNQGWWVPTYVIEGDAERGIEPMAPDLRSVSDLPQYKELFADPEDPDKGRFYDCIAGWECERVNEGKFEAYGLGQHYNRFLPGSDAALATSIVAAYERGDPWFGYYWAPTWIFGLVDLTKIEEPEFTEECWDQIFTGEEACAYPLMEIHIATSPEFAEAAPEVIEFLENSETTVEQINAALSYMQENDATPDDAAVWFLQEHEDVWTNWVPADVAERVKESLEGM
ncbi:MAG: ABC transporter substrate-binding protein [Chloroflexia bacterium]|nr:ABC transporter substrate-binding protein [Chloroflexia bacterium]